MAVQSSLIGTWRLLSYEHRYSDGRVDLPWGEGAIGYLTYTADGHVFVVGESRGRQPFAADRPPTPTAEEALAAVNSYQAYGGTYELREPGTVIHHIETSMVPNLIGDRLRHYELKGERLSILTAPVPLADGGTVCSALVWQRV